MALKRIFETSIASTVLGHQGHHGKVLHHHDGLGVGLGEGEGLGVTEGEGAGEGEGQGSCQVPPGLMIGEDGLPRFQGVEMSPPHPAAAESSMANAKARRAVLEDIFLKR